MECIICGKEIEESIIYGVALCSDECFTTDFWNEKVEWKETRKDVIVRVNGVHYTIDHDESGDPSWRGHGGAKFNIKFFDGREVTTTNLWCQGSIPEAFREKLPDNAEFIKEPQRCQGYIRVNQKED